MDMYGLICTLVTCSAMSDLYDTVVRIKCRKSNFETNASNEVLLYGVEW